jgi:hypothetical protein
MQRASAACLLATTVVLLSLQPAADAGYVIAKDDGRRIEDHPIDSLDDFLEFAGLDVELANGLQAEGLVLDDLQAITDEDLEAIGMEKIMHRSRFMRYAKQLRVAAEAPAGGSPAPAPPKKQKKQKAPSPPKAEVLAEEVQMGEDDGDIIRHGKEAHDPEAEQARWAAADKQRKEDAKKDAKRRKAEQKNAGGPRAGTPDGDFAAAVEDEDVEGVEAALAAGADVNVLIPVDGDSQTGLMYSSLMGFVEVADVLLQHDADFNIGMSQAGFTPLHGAAFQAHPDIIKLLLDAGADPLHRHQDGFVPMHRSCWGTTPRHTESVIVFLEHGVDVLTSAKDPDNSPQYEEQGGMMTPHNMSGTNPMTIGLLREWEKYGRKPEGSMGYWGADAFDSEDVVDATVRHDDL